MMLILGFKKSRGEVSVKILVSGSSGLIGSALLPVLKNEGHPVSVLKRHHAYPDHDQEPFIQWNPESSDLDSNKLKGIESVIHLAGENIAARRWSPKQKAKIRDSRIKGTTLLSETLAKMDSPPHTLLAASAIGYYGNRGSEILQEDTASGTGFLPDVCRNWESAAVVASKRGIRVVYLRFGIILSPHGGALSKMLLPFRMGVGGKIGTGQQYMSWISLDDAVGAISHALNERSIQGVVNVVSPNPVTNSQFTKTLGKVLSRPTLFPVPSFAASLAFGEMADALLLASSRVKPRQLLTTGFKFKHPELETALKHLLGK